mgnify:CR=1 FL=1
MVPRITKVGRNGVRILRSVASKNAFLDAGRICVSRSAEHNVDLRVLLFRGQASQGLTGRKAQEIHFDAGVFGELSEDFRSILSGMIEYALSIFCVHSTCDNGKTRNKNGKLKTHGVYSWHEWFLIRRNVIKHIRQNLANCNGRTSDSNIPEKHLSAFWMLSAQRKTHLAFLGN